MKTILITTDFSADSKNAARYSFELARQIKANVLLCNAMIVPAEIPQSGVLAWPVDCYDELMADSTAELNKLKEELLSAEPQDGFLPAITCFNQAGTVRDVIEEAVEKQRADLVVAGPHGSGGVGQWLIGNHLRRLIDSTTLPLLLVPANAAFRQIKKIAFATDFNNMKQDLNSIYELVKIAKTLDAQVLLVHIDDEPDSSARMKSFLVDILRELAEKTGYEKIDYQLVNNSRAVAGLDWVCKHGQVEMLAMVHRPHSLVDDLLSGSKTKKMAGHINIPLLVFPDKKAV
ncbi:MAG: universal stress protein [Mucilaginibacter sp.]